MDTYKGCISDTFDLRAYRQREIWETNDGTNAALAQLLALIARDPRNKRQVVVTSPTFITDGRPRANIAVFDWLRIGLWFGASGFFKVTPNLAEVGDVMLNGESLGSRASSQHNVHPLRFYSLKT